MSERRAVAQRVPAPPSPTGTSPSGLAAGGMSMFALESSGSRMARRVRRARLYLYSLVAIGLLAYIVALADSNARHVRVDWVFGTSSVALAWLVLLATILGGLLGVLLTAAFRWGTGGTA
jgi:uncharacterized integral membrane protein